MRVARLGVACTWIGNSVVRATACDPVPHSALTLTNCPPGFVPQDTRFSLAKELFGPLVDSSAEVPPPLDSIVTVNVPLTSQ